MGLNPALLSGAVTLIDELFTTKEEQAAAKLKLMELVHRGNLAQLEVNAQEAQHPSVFVSGWRPATGWICVSAMALSFLIFPIIHSIAIYYTAFTGEYVDLSGLPTLDWGTLGPLILGMLGLSGLRTKEKTDGTARR